MSTNRPDSQKDINSVAFTGTATFDAEHRVLQSGKDLTKIRVMIRGYGNAVFVRVTGWEDIAVAMKSAQKGDRLSVSGRLSYSEWTDKQGAKRTEVEVTAHEFSVLETVDDVARGLSGLSHAGAAAQAYVEAVKSDAPVPGQTSIEF